MGIRYGDFLIRAEGRGRFFLFPLTLLSYVYGLVVYVRLVLYRAGLLRRRKLTPRVISIGNLTAGGTGKTPMVRALARQLTDQGEKVAIISRGYKRKGRSPFTVVSKGEGPLVRWQEAGEEPYWLAETCKNVSVLVGKDRYQAGVYAVEQYHPTVILLDDGFQHLQLKRDLDLLLIDGMHPFGNHHLLPRGFLREPLSQMKRAHGIILTRVDQAKNIEGTLNKIRQFAGPKPLFQSQFRPLDLVAIPGGMPQGLEMIRGKRVLAVSGIGNPTAFHKMLLSLGAKEVIEKVFPDHFSYGPSDVKEIFKKGTAMDLIVTTEKDGVKLAPLINPSSAGHSSGISGEGLTRDSYLWTLRVEVKILERKEWEDFIRGKGPGALVSSKDN